MRCSFFLVTVLASFIAAPAWAQEPQLAGERPEAVAGVWEISNADRDRRCVVTLRPQQRGRAFGLEFERGCAESFPFTRAVVAWSAAGGGRIDLLDDKGQLVVEFTEVEIGLYEAMRQGDGLLFLQTAAAGAGEERKAEQLFGDWTLMRRADNPICQLTLANTPSTNDSFLLRLKPGCDAAVTRFNPVAWRLDRGQLVLIPARGASWRFEEADASTWRRIPERRDPLLLVRQ